MSVSKSLFGLCLGLCLGHSPLLWAEGSEVCEAIPKSACLDRSEIEGKVFDLPADAMGLSRDGLNICNSSYLYTTAPDVILILDNTGSMAKVRTVNGIPRYCDFPADPNAYAEDPGCVSGDPDTLRAKALQAFVDSALVKGGQGTRVGVILFSDRVLNGDDVAWTPLLPNSAQAIKAQIVTDADGATNYYAAFKAAVDLLKTSTKPREEQTIIFVSDGRPNRPLSFDGGPYLYKQYLDGNQLPPVHSIFLGDQSINFQDLKEISEETGGLFFAIRDVSQMAGILTDSISKQLFRRALPTGSTVTNLTNKASFTVSASDHEPNADTTAYTLHLPGPLALVKNLNDILIRTQYGNGGTSVDLQFTLRRGGGASIDTNLFAFSCRPPAHLALLNAQGQNLSQGGDAFGLSDSVAVVRLITQAQLDTFPIGVNLRERETARSDAETLGLPAPQAADTLFTGEIRFAHQASEKISGNGALDGVHGDKVVAVWRNPYLPDDTASATAFIRYGPDVLIAALFDEDQDGRAETARIRLAQDLRLLPERMRLRMKAGDGQTVERIATHKDDEIAFVSDRGREIQNELVIQLNLPFPKDATTTDPRDEAGHFFRQDNIPLVDADFPVEDSIAPALFSAEIKEVDRAHAMRRIAVTFTEPVLLNDKALEPFRFRREAQDIEGEDIPIDHIEVLSPTTLDIYLQPGAPFQPVGGDSIAIAVSDEISDAHNRFPRTLFFTVMTGKNPEQKVKDLFVTFGDGRKSGPDAGSEYSRPSGPSFLPLDSSGAALQGTGNGKCGSCHAGGEGDFHGSVIHVTVPGPVRYELMVFSNLGAFVNRFDGAVEDKDLRFLSRRSEGEGDQKQTFYTQRIVWNGKTATGEMANTGAYVLKAIFHFDRNAQTGGRAARESQFKRFGFLRNCCRTSNHWAEFDFDVEWPR